jgi:hypothetical protein
MNECMLVPLLHLFVVAFSGSDLLDHTFYWPKETKMATFKFNSPCVFLPQTERRIFGVPVWVLKSLWEVPTNIPR